MWRSLLSLGAHGRLRWAVLAPVPLVGLMAVIGPLAVSAGSVDAREHPAAASYRALPQLPVGSAKAGPAGVEASAIALAASLGAVPIDAVGGTCPPDDLAVSWNEPAQADAVGAHVTPLGPAPTAGTRAVNGIVICTGSTFGYMGFEARYAAGRWDVVDVPFVGHEEDEHELVAQPAPVIPTGPRPVPVLVATGTVTGPIEGYAAYEPQRTCDPSAKTGTRALAGALLRDYAGSRNLGIVRGCGVGGRSEHKEGRAFDWGVNIANAGERAAAEAFIGALLATDADGNHHALARRMGVMYVIWDRQIWSSYRSGDGWRPYSGSSAHRDHVHISLSWAGATARTSFWSGTVPPDLPVASPNTSTVGSARGRSRDRGAGSDAAATARTGRGDHRRDHDGDAPPVRLSREQLAAGVAALWHDGVAPTAAEIEAWLVGQGVTQERAAQYAAWAADRAAHTSTDEATNDHHRSDSERDERAAREAERQRQRDEWARQQAEREAARQAERDRRAADEEATRADDHEHGSGGGRGDGRHGGRRGGDRTTSTTLPTTTTSTTLATTTTSTTAPSTTTTTAPPETTTTTVAPPELTTTTTTGP